MKKHIIIIIIIIISKTDTFIFYFKLIPLYFFPTIFLSWCPLRGSVKGKYPVPKQNKNTLLTTDFYFGSFSQLGTKWQSKAACTKMNSQSCFAECK